MKHLLELTTSQIQQLIWAIDLCENALEDLVDEDLENMGIDINKTELFAIAITLEKMVKTNG
jgi:hypothetical protein